MKQFTGFVAGLSQQFDKIAGLCIAGVMLLVVSNILLRTVFNRPILGTYELVGLLTALGIGLALANCAFQNAHIAVDFVVDHFPLRLQAIVDSSINLISLVFWSLSAWHLGKYASNMTVSGVVSSTAQVPVYPFIYLVATGLSGLCLVLILRWMDSTKKAFAGASFTRLHQQEEWIDYARKAMR